MGGFHPPVGTEPWKQLGVTGPLVAQGAPGSISLARVLASRHKRLWGESN